MKYFKEYKKSENVEEIYRKVSKFELDNFENSKEDECFTKLEFNKIYDFIENEIRWKYKDRNNARYNGISVEVQANYMIISFQYVGQKFRIEKFEDEWFTLYFFGKSKEYYICDQKYGLYSCISANISRIDDDFIDVNKELYKCWYKKIK